MGIFKRKSKLSPDVRKGPENSNHSVFSYYARGNSSSNQNLGRRESNGDGSNSKYKFRFRYLPSYAAGLVIVLALGYACIIQSNPIIIVVNDSNTLQRDTKAYKDAIKTTWGKSLLNRSKITVNTASIKSEIETQFPELASVKIELPLVGRRPTVILTPQKPALQIVSVNGSFYVDSSGKVMARTSDLKQNNITNLPLIRDESGITADPGSGIIPATETVFLNKLYELLLAEKIDIESIILPINSANEADLRIKGQSYFVKFSIDSEPRQAVGTYLAAKSKLSADGITPNEYLDVRVDEKVFYK